MVEYKGKNAIQWFKMIVKNSYNDDLEIAKTIGIVETSKYGKIFHELYEKSDGMLYEIKKNIKLQKGI